MVEAFAFPSLLYFLYLIPLFLQALALQTTSQPRLFATTRFLLIFPTTILATLAPINYQFQPKELCIISNIVLGLGSVYATWKSIEWGLVRDLSAYDWIGFEEKKDSKEGNVILKKKGFSIGQALHLLCSLRGIGYRFGPSPSPKMTNSRFLRRTIFNLIWSHILCILTIGALAEPDLREWSSLQGMALGSMALAGLICGFSVLSLLALFLSWLFSYPFDPREYPDFIVNPPIFISSATIFWSKIWHSAFSRSFKSLAYSPSRRIFPGLLGKGVGTILVFCLSAQLHQQAISSAMWRITPSKELSWLKFHGGSIYFLIQGFAMIFEGWFQKITGRRIDTYGVFAYLYGYIVVGLSGALLSSSWIEQGVFEGQPPIYTWTIQRFIFPLAPFLPATIFCKH